MVMSRVSWLGLVPVLAMGAAAFGQECSCSAPVLIPGCAAPICSPSCAAPFCDSGFVSHGTCEPCRPTKVINFNFCFSTGDKKKGDKTKYKRISALGALAGGEAPPQGFAAASTPVSLVQAPSIAVAFASVPAFAVDSRAAAAAAPAAAAASGSKACEPCDDILQLKEEVKQLKEITLNLVALEKNRMAAEKAKNSD